jgi:ribosomal protein S11
MALGTYRLQDPSGKELQALVHGNRLVKAHLNSFEALAKLWASPAAKDALRRMNKRVELVRSDADGTQRLDRLLLGDSFKQIVEQVPVEGDEDLTRQQVPHLTEPAAGATVNVTVQDHQGKRPHKRRKQGIVTPAMRRSTRTKKPAVRYGD